MTRPHLRIRVRGRGAIARVRRRRSVAGVRRRGRRGAVRLSIPGGRAIARVRGLLRRQRFEVSNWLLHELYSFIDRWFHATKGRIQGTASA